jgi:hypothetical protein
MKLILGLLLFTLGYSGQVLAEGDRVKFNLRTTVWIINGDVQPTFQEQTVEHVMENTATGSDMAQIDIPLTLLRPDTERNLTRNLSLSFCVP